MRKLIVEDISDSATGHLHLGLLETHGMDEGGGDPRTPDLGAHDAMWFACRDLVFGKDAYPIPAPPESISRPVNLDREMPLIGPQYERLIKMLMNVLMIEVRAGSFFAFCCDVLRDPTLFVDRREAADQAATLVERVRQDEQIHVGYLQAVISELRAFTLRAVDGREVPGHEIIDPVWANMVDWHGLREREASRGRVRSEIERQAIDRLGPEAGARLMAPHDGLEATA